MVYHDLKPSISARFIRFQPTAWRKMPSMRVELYGCKGIYIKIEIKGSEIEFKFSSYEVPVCYVKATCLQWCFD